MPVDTVLEFVAAMRFGLTLPQDSVFELLSAFGLPGALIGDPQHADAAADLDLNLRALKGVAGDPDEIEMAAETMLEAAEKMLLYEAFSQTPARCCATPITACCIS